MSFVAFVPAKEESMKGSLGFIAMVLGILGIARGGIDAPHQSVGQLFAPGAGIVSIATLAAVFLLVGGLLVLAKSARFSFGSSQSDATLPESDGALPPWTADAHPNENS
jgi:hypothetical protein